MPGLALDYTVLPGAVESGSVICWGVREDGVLTKEGKVKEWGESGVML